MDLSVAENRLTRASSAILDCDNSRAFSANHLTNDENPQTFAFTRVNPPGERDRRIILKKEAEAFLLNY